MIPPPLNLICRLALTSLLLVPVTGCFKPDSTDKKRGASQNSVERVVASSPVRKDLKVLTTQPGQIDAFETTPLFSKIAGFVESISVDIGDHVKQGDMLVRLSAPELQDDLARNDALVLQAHAEIKQAEAAVSAAQSAVRTAAALRDQTTASADAAEASRIKWQSERNRIVDLAASGSVTQKLAEEAENQLKAAEATCRQTKAGIAAAEAALDESRVKVRKAEADQEASQSRVRVALANLAHAKTMCAYTEIKAPFDGVITRREVDTGHFVQPISGTNAKPLVVVARTDQVRIFVDVPEPEAPLVDAGADGDVATVRVQAIGNRKFEARVARTSWSLTSSNWSLRTEIDIPNEEQRLRPGMYATAVILLDTRLNALSLPMTAITRKGSTYECCCVVDGVIRRCPIELGVRSGNEVEVLSGIQDSDVVVLARTESLVDGQSVNVVAPE